MNCNGMIEHEVEAGDTLYKLSRQYKTTVSALILQNPKINPYNLQIGMKIEVCPGPDYYPADGMNGDGMNRPGMDRPGMNSGMDRPGMNGGMEGNGMPNRASFADRMRMAWMDHVYLVNSFINSVAGAMPDQQEVASELIRNAEEIADLFARYYPQGEVQQLKQLLLDHVELTGALITETSAGNDARAESQKQRLLENATQIAQLMAGATPEYDERYLKEMLDMHIDLVGQLLSERMAGEYVSQMQTLRKAQRQAIAMADYFSDGLRREAEASGLRPGPTDTTVR